MDPGGENISNEILEYFEQLNIQHLCTAAQAEFSNGIVERVGETLREISSKVKRDHPSLQLEDILAKSTAAVNSMLNVHGFSPSQLVTGVSPSIPSSLTDEPPASGYDTRQPRVEAISTARSAMAAAEASNRIRRALKSHHSNSTTVSAIPLHSTVYFYHDQLGHAHRGWRGPGKVIGTNPDSHAIFIEYGGRIWSRHVTRVRLVADDSSTSNAEDENSTDCPPVVDSVPPKHQPPISPDDSDDESDEETSPSQPEPESEESDGSLNASSTPDDDPSDETPLGGPMRECDESSSTVSTSDPDDPLYEPDSQFRSDASDDEPHQTRSQTRAAAQHESSQPPQTSPPHLIDGDESGMDDVLFALENAREKFAASAPELVYYANQSSKKVAKHEIDPESEEFVAAREKELKSIRDNRVYEPCHVRDLPPGTQIISSRFVLAWKDLDDGLKMAKARLVARGFQEDVTDEAVDAPTATKESLRLACHLVAQNRWSLQSIDVKTAFLQADVRGPDEKTIAIKPPREANEAPGTVWLLRKSLYGLRSAPKAWWKTLTSALVKEFGFHQCAFDQACFTVIRDGKSIGVLVLHVDDMLVAGNIEFLKILEKLQLRFKFGSIRRGKFIHVGVEFASHSDGSITLSQKTYIESLKEVPMASQRKTEVDSPLTPSETHELRRLIGGMLWVSGMTRADIAADMCVLSTKLTNPTVADILRANKTLRYLKGSSEHAMTIRPMEGKISVTAFADSAFQNLDRQGSQGGQMIGLTSEGSNQFVTVSWKSARIKRVVRSTFSAELLSQSNSFDTASWIRELYDEMRSGKRKSMEGPRSELHMKTDCQSLVDSTRSLRIQVTERRLSAEVWALREALEAKEITSLEHVPTEAMIADGLTKIQPKLRVAVCRACAGYL